VRQSRCALSGLSSSSFKATNTIVGAPSSWLHLILITSQGPYLPTSLIHDLGDYVCNT
jgi:hypothetical protein